jgi:hypothetical protein
MFIDEWFEKDYYKQLPLGYHVQSSYQPGQFFWTHLLYTVENLELWRAVLDPNEPTKTIATDFRITTAGRDAFKRSLPLAVPHLETNEEFIVTRAKRRPVLLIQPQAADMAVDNKGYKGKVQRKKCLVAPIYGLADPKTGTPDFNPAFVDRVRKMEFPQLLFLPKAPGLLEVDSVARLDELQSVFTPHLDATQYALGDEVQQLLRGQIQLFVANVGPSFYTELREELLKS